MIFKIVTSVKHSLLLSGIFICLVSCNRFKKNQTHQAFSESGIANGKVLAAKYCQSCHLLPDPSLLGAKNWEKGVLPNMGPRLGIFYHGSENYPSAKSDFNLPRNFYPDKPMLNKEEWQNIIDYYLALSPDSLPAAEKKQPLKTGVVQFKIEVPSFKQPLPATCFIRIDSLSPSLRQIVVSDAVTKTLYRYDKQLKIIDSFKTGSPVVDIERKQHKLIACGIGVMNPNNAKYGSAFMIADDVDGKMKIDTGMKINNLARPVQISTADFNGDGKRDMLVCEYGHLTGALSWMENTGDNKYERHLIKEVPGAIKACVEDINKDGLPDIWVLFSQGDESIFLFTNKGNGKFEEEQLLRFPAIYGSSYFELADFNKDGYPDIVYTCGDNADYSLALKPYHGVYIFLNDGSNHFKQQYFYPMHGCFKAMARDFDGDGDLDLAAISFFADYLHHPEESFLYFENSGNLDFQPYSIPGTSSGRWLTMDAGDIDGDGKTDIVLGNFSIAPSFIKSAVDWKKATSFIILKNITAK
jgi:hypothetical protein